MPKVKRDWDLLSVEQRQIAINEIIGYFETERDERIGVIAAGELLDFFLQTAGFALYNKGVDNTKDLIKNRLEEALIDVEVSLKKTKN